MAKNFVDMIPELPNGRDELVVTGSSVEPILGLHLELKMKFRHILSMDVTPEGEILYDGLVMPESVQARTRRMGWGADFLDNWLRVQVRSHFQGHPQHQGDFFIEWDMEMVFRSLLQLRIEGREPTSKIRDLRPRSQKDQYLAGRAWMCSAKGGREFDHVILLDELANGPQALFEAQHPDTVKKLRKQGYDAQILFPLVTSALAERDAQRPVMKASAWRVVVRCPDISGRTFYRRWKHWMYGAHHNGRYLTSARRQLAGVRNDKAGTITFPVRLLRFAEGAEAFWQAQHPVTRAAMERLGLKAGEVRKLARAGYQRMQAEFANPKIGKVISGQVDLSFPLHTLPEAM